MIGRLFFNENVDENDTINLVDKDGFLNSEEDQKEEYRNEMSMGIRSKVGYLMKFYGMSEEEAKKELALVNEEDNLQISNMEAGVWNKEINFI